MIPNSEQLKFLIVDDNKMIRETLIRFIKHDGDEILECEDGKNVVALYQNHQPDWVLMDINMKEVNGIEATERIVAHDPHAKVLIVTDYGDRFFRKAAKDAGAYGFITKEDLSELQSIVRMKP
jgi:two-component system, NarL family, response regulator DegU